MRMGPNTDSILTMIPRIPKTLMKGKKIKHDFKRVPPKFQTIIVMKLKNFIYTFKIDFWQDSSSTKGTWLLNNNE